MIVSSGLLAVERMGREAKNLLFFKKEALSLPSSTCSIGLDQHHE